MVRPVEPGYGSKSNPLVTPKMPDYGDSKEGKLARDISDDPGFVLPLKQDTKSPWVLVDANGRMVSVFVAMNEKAGSLSIAEIHCRMVAETVNKMHMPSPEAMIENPPLCNINDLRIIQRLVVMWADSAFPDRSPLHAFTKMYSEIGELIDHPHDGMEYADVFILLVDLANMHGVTNLGECIQAKMKLNANRQWTKNAMGIMRHVPEEQHLKGELDKHTDGVHQALVERVLQRRDEQYKEQRLPSGPLLGGIESEGGEL